MSWRSYIILCTEIFGFSITIIFTRNYLKFNVSINNVIGTYFMIINYYKFISFNFSSNYLGVHLHPSPGLPSNSISCIFLTYTHPLILYHSLHHYQRFFGICILHFPSVYIFYNNHIVSIYYLFKTWSSHLDLLSLISFILSTMKASYFIFIKYLLLILHFHVTPFIHYI